MLVLLVMISLLRMIMKPPPPNKNIYVTDLRTECVTLLHVVRQSLPNRRFADYFGHDVAVDVVTVVQKNMSMGASVALKNIMLKLFGMGS